MKYDLSICIPHYNRRECLQELLDSITNQTDDPHQVEICISDDASSDDSENLIREYQKQHPNVIYYRFPEHVGYDRNLLNSVSIASGDYCWLTGNDDKIEQGAVNLITKRLKEQENITMLNLNGWRYDSHLKVRLSDMVDKGLNKKALQSDRLFNSLEDILSLFGDSMGFLGENIVKRSSWNDVVSSSDLSRYSGFGLFYIHVAIFLNMLQRNPSLLYIHQQCIGYRSDNDGLMPTLGHLQRLKVDAIGYNQVAEVVFSRKSHYYKLLMSQIIKAHIRKRVLGIKLSQPDILMSEIASFTYKEFAGLPAFWIHILPLLIFPRSALLALRAIYRSTLKETS